MKNITNKKEDIVVYIISSWWTVCKICFFKALLLIFLILDRGLYY